jgi:hypothetical protein
MITSRSPTPRPAWTAFGLPAGVVLTNGLAEGSPDDGGAAPRLLRKSLRRRARLNRLSALSVALDNAGRCGALSASARSAGSGWVTKLPQSRNEGLRGMPGRATGPRGLRISGDALPLRAVMPPRPAGAALGVAFLPVRGVSHVRDGSVPDGKIRLRSPPVIGLRTGAITVLLCLA